MIVVVRGRQGGKTRAALEWLKEGHAIGGYPGWSRVLLAATRQECTRVTNLLREHTEGQEFAGIHDLRKAVWTIGDLRSAGHYLQRYAVELGVDDADNILAYLLGVNGRLALISVTGDWE